MENLYEVILKQSSEDGVSLDLLMGNEKAHMAKMHLIIAYVNPAQSLRTNKSGKEYCQMPKDQW